MLAVTNRNLVLHFNSKRFASFRGSSCCNCIVMAKCLQMQDENSPKKLKVVQSSCTVS